MNKEKDEDIKPEADEDDDKVAERGYDQKLCI